MTKSVSLTTKFISPAFNFHLHVWNLVGPCIRSGRTKKSLGAIPQVEQEVRHFEITVQLLSRFLRVAGDIFHSSPPKALSHGTSNFVRVISRPLWSNDSIHCFFWSNDVDVRSWRISMKFRLFAMKQLTAVTPLHMVGTFPNFTRTIRVLVWRHT